MEKIHTKKIAQIGSGFVGKAAGKGFSKFGHEVTFYDVKPEVISGLREAGFRAEHIDTLATEKKRFDLFMMSVPTPTINDRVELNYLAAALDEVGKYIGKAKNYPVIVVRSTVPPGTTEEMVIPALEKMSGKQYKKDFGISMNPEFLREIKAEEDFSNPWITVIGANDEKSAAIMDDLYMPFKAPITHMSIKEAEMTKYIHNLLNATKISFFNEIRMVSERMGIDPELEFKTAVKSAEAIWNPEYGTKNFGPYGGSCLPKDTKGFFTWALEKFNLELPVLKATMATNEILKKSRIPACIGQGCKTLSLMKVSEQQH